MTEEAHWKTTSIDATQDASELISELPRTSEELHSRIESTIPLLKDTSLDKIQIIHHRLRVDIGIPLSNMTSTKLKREAVEKLVQIECSAQLITDYLRFLWELGWDSDSVITETYK